MKTSIPTEVEKEKIHQFYLACSSLLQGGTIPAISVQRAFEEAMSGFLAENTWRPTHISRIALREAVCGNPKNLQRAHGVVGNRKDRYARTVEVLSKSYKLFEDWWDFYKEHDATVLITKEEHASNRSYLFDELIELPHPSHGMFERSGFSFKMRKKVEIAWLRTKLAELEP
jgi:hypothetical protein